MHSWKKDAEDSSLCKENLNDVKEAEFDEAIIKEYEDAKEKGLIKIFPIEKR